MGRYGGGGTERSGEGCAAHLADAVAEADGVAVALALPAHVDDVAVLEELAHGAVAERAHLLGPLPEWGGARTGVDTTVTEG